MGIGEKLEQWWNAEECTEEIYEIIQQVQALERQKNDAYHERDKLVAALSKMFPASLERHPAEEEWEDDWRWIVFVELPTGQATWHIHDSELPMFKHLLRETGLRWDGHTTDEKYQRLAALEPRYKTIEHFREGQQVQWQGDWWLLEKIEPYGDDYLLCLDRKTPFGSHYCPVSLRVYNDALARETR